ncbi:alpha-glucosidase maltase [Quaeritorhiza haematococci]|nr:alpha-glucosidase maltase [Quaeritorhiza haematococci]
MVSTNTIHTAPGPQPTIHHRSNTPNPLVKTVIPNRPLSEQHVQTPNADSAFQRYSVANVQQSDTTFTADLVLGPRNAPRALPELGPDLVELTLSVTCETDTRIHVVISDKENKRWAIPDDLFPRPASDPGLFSSRTNVGQAGGIRTQQHIPQYRFELIDFSQGLRIDRRDRSTPVSEDEPALFEFYFDQIVFKRQYIEFTNRAVAKNANIHGLGENVGPFRHNPNNSSITIFARDSRHALNENLYGAHPVYMELRRNRSKRAVEAHAVFLLNSTGMDVFLNPGAITYKIMGGILDFYVVTGPHPYDVCRQYAEIVGRPAMMPYWTLGFHQCRWGYKSIKSLEHVVKKFDQHRIPLEAMWVDIDYMDAFKDFTFDPVNYPLARVGSFIEGMQAEGRKVVMIVDPGIKVEKGYEPFHSGLDKDIYLKVEVGSRGGSAGGRDQQQKHDRLQHQCLKMQHRVDGKGGAVENAVATKVGAQDVVVKERPFVGKVWPGWTVFPDFMNPGSVEWWADCFRHWYQTIPPLDGIWIDMNEVANFWDGESPEIPTTAAASPTSCAPIEASTISPEQTLLEGTPTPFDILSFKVPNPPVDVHNMMSPAQATVMEASEPLVTAFDYEDEKSFGGGRDGVGERLLVDYVLDFEEEINDKEDLMGEKSGQYTVTTEDKAVADADRINTQTSPKSDGRLSRMSMASSDSSFVMVEREVAGATTPTKVYGYPPPRQEHPGVHVHHDPFNLLGVSGIAAPVAPPIRMNGEQDGCKTGQLAGIKPFDAGVGALPNTITEASYDRGFYTEEPSHDGEDLDSPPYKINNGNTHAPLSTHTTSMKAYHRHQPLENSILDLAVRGSDTANNAANREYALSGGYHTDNHKAAGMAGKATGDADSIKRFTRVFEYDCHQLYGHAEARATYAVLLELMENADGNDGQDKVGKLNRPFILSRSTFAGTGRWAAHWLGDNESSWDSMMYSISGCLNFQFYGIHMVGADIGGFHGTTTLELLTRWMQVGAFYPFCRNHNVLGSPSQEPYVHPIVAAVSRKVLDLRYRLIPYWYTLLWDGHATGMPVIRPVGFEFGNKLAALADTENIDDEFEKLCAIDQQFLVGPALLVTPVLTKGATSVRGYFPMLGRGETWYDVWDGKELVPSAPSATRPSPWVDLSAPLDHIPVHVRGGHIIPMHSQSLKTTAAMRDAGRYTLLVALTGASTNNNSSQTASGQLYLDDGEMWDPLLEMGKNAWMVRFDATGGCVKSTGVIGGDKGWLVGSGKKRDEDGDGDLGWTVPVRWEIDEVVVLGVRECVRVDDGSSVAPADCSTTGKARTTRLAGSGSANVSVRVLVDGQDSVGEWNEKDHILRVRGLKRKVAESFCLRWWGMS